MMVENVKGFHAAPLLIDVWAIWESEITGTLEFSDWVLQYLNTNGKIEWFVLKRALKMMSLLKVQEDSTKMYLEINPSKSPRFM